MVKATGNVVSSFGIRTDDLVVAMCVVATVCFEQKSAAKSFEGVLYLAFFVVKAPSNVVSSFGIGADELVVAMCVDAADCFALKSAAMSL